VLSWPNLKTIMVAKTRKQSTTISMKFMHSTSEIAKAVILKTFLFVITVKKKKQSSTEKSVGRGLMHDVSSVVN